MKKFILALVILSLSTVAYGANTGWDPKPDGVHAKSPVIPLFLNQSAIDVLTPTAGSIVHNTTTGTNQWYDGAAWLDYNLSTFGNLSVIGNLNVTGDGPHNFSAVMDNATGNESGLKLECTTNKVTSGNDDCFVVDQIDTLSPAISLLASYRKNGTPMVTIDNAGEVRSEGGKFRIGNSNWHDSTGLHSLFGTTPIVINATSPNVAINQVEMAKGTSSISSGIGGGVAVLSTYNQSGTAKGRNIYSNISTISEGSGGLYHAEYQTERSTVFSVDDEGTMNVGGGVAFSGITTAFSNFSVPLNIHAILGNATTGAFTVTLPPVASVPIGFEIQLKKWDSTMNTITLVGAGGETIDNELTCIVKDYKHHVTVYSNGSGWVKSQSTPTIETSLSSLWVNGKLVQTTITNQSEFVDITHFVNLGEEDENSNAVGSPANDNITIGAAGGGDYMIQQHVSTKMDSGTNHEILVVPKITLATPKTITDATNATPIVVTTSVAHLLKTGDYVTQSGVVGNTAANGDFYTTFLTSTTYSLQAIDTTYSDVAGNGAYVSGGTVDAEYPGNIAQPVSRSQTLFGRGASSDTHDLFAGDVISLSVLNRSNANEIDFTQIQLGIERTETE